VKICRILILILPLAIACSDCTESKVPSNSVTGSDEYDVLSALIDTEFASRWTENQHALVLIARSPSWAHCLSDDSVYVLRYIGAAIPQASKALALDLWRVTRGPNLWQDSFKTRTPYALAGDTSINPSYWICGTLTLSRVGFNSDHTQALVDAYFHCGMTCGEGYLSYFKKKCNRWVLIRKYVCSRS
jgi:hypothetical protein